MQLTHKPLLHYRNPLLYILIFGILLRFLFLWKGASVYYGAQSIHENGDTFSYVRSFNNLIEKGHYTFDESIPEASFGRLPGFPFFYGLHYLVFGKANAYLATSITQAILDSIAILLIYLTVLHISGRRLSALIAAFIYATYPFIIVWTTIMGTELLGTFLAVLFFYILITQKDKRYYFFLLGIVLCFAFFTREFLAIFIPITLLYFYLEFGRYNFKKFIRVSFIMGLGFLLFYLPWPIRNYLNHDRFMPIKPAHAGYASMKPDALSYFLFVDAWSVENNFWFYEVKKDTKIDFPKEIFKNEQDALLADSLITLGRRCGSGFYFRKYDVNWPGGPTCDEEIEAGFKYLTKEYIKHNPFEYFVIVPLQKLKKALFKTQLITEEVRSFKSLITTILFGYRSFLILIGIIGLFLFFRKRDLLPITIYFSFIYFFICFIFRGVEIRYFLQADVLLIIPAAMLLDRVLNRIGISKRV